MKYGESFTDRESDGYEDDEIFMSDSDPDEPSCLLKESDETSDGETSLTASWVKSD